MLCCQIAVVINQNYTHEKCEGYSLVAKTQYTYTFTDGLLYYMKIF